MSRDKLSAIAAAAAIQGKLCRQIMADTVKAFADDGIPLVALKGTANGFMGYSDPAHRTGADLDFCVPPGDVERSKEIMARVGLWAGDYDTESEVFVPSDEAERAARETGHYALGFWVKVIDIGEVAAPAAAGFRMAGDMLPFASEVTGKRVRTPILVDIHHSIGGGVSSRSSPGSR